MAAKKTKTPKLLKHFNNYEDQESKDLAYGGQKATCKAYAKKDTSYRDQSIDGWTPDED